MDTITIKGKTLELDGSGFLADPATWDLDVANYIAAVEGIQMSEHHWAVVNFLRDYYGKYQTAPTIKVLTKEIANKIGTENSNRKYLNNLYPCGLAMQACKIAGLPRSIDSIRTTRPFYK